MCKFPMMYDYLKGTFRIREGALLDSSCFLNEKHEKKISNQELTTIAWLIFYAIFLVPSAQRDLIRVNKPIVDPFPVVDPSE